MDLSFGPYNILWVTSRSINCHMALSAINYLINIIPHTFISSNQLCQPVRSIFCDLDRSSGPKCYINYLPLCVIRKSLVRQCFESLENKMSSGRFASLNEAELDQITDSRLSQNTKNATKYAVKTVSLLTIFLFLSDMSGKFKYSY